VGVGWEGFVASGPWEETQKAACFSEDDRGSVSRRACFSEEVTRRFQKSLVFPKRSPNGWRGLGVALVKQGCLQSLGRVIVGGAQGR
jgi:hypothetical protein